MGKITSIAYACKGKDLLDISDKNVHFFFHRVSYYVKTHGMERKPAKTFTWTVSEYVLYRTVSIQISP